jgi:N-acetylmuramoyl-L-alanine amidase
MPDHTVKQGDCIESIAKQHGYFWQTLWNHPRNAALKQSRKDPDVLFPGDVVHIPKKTEKLEPGETEQRHRFRCKGVPSKLRITLKDESDKPRTDLPYTLEIDGQTFSGTTDSEGGLQHSIPPNAKRGKLTVRPPEEEEEGYNLQLGHMDPVTEISGVQARLSNLGFECGQINGALSRMTQEGIRAFQAKHGLEITGRPDEATEQKLKEEHGS